MTVKTFSNLVVNYAAAPTAMYHHSEERQNAVVSDKNLRAQLVQSTRMVGKLPKWHQPSDQCTVGYLVSYGRLH
jgi:hypothetical protein